MLIRIRTEDAAVSCFWTEDGAATGARVIDDSEIGRHLLHFGKAALRAGDDCIKFEQVLELNHHFSWLTHTDG